MAHFTRASLARVLNLHASSGDSQIVGLIPIVWSEPKPRAVFADNFRRGHYHWGVVPKHGTFLWSLTDRPAYWCQLNLITAIAFIALFNRGKNSYEGFFLKIEKKRQTVD